ncbi:MAG TPA: histidine kinase [Verrucomicrobiae bacterium]|nr:histidine kinase [Verrucomicrobiae bacterium]
MTLSNSQLAKVARAYLLSFGFWLTLATLLSSQQYVIERDLRWHIPFPQLLLLTTIRFAAFATLTPPLFYIVRRYPVTRNKPVGKIIIYALGSAAFVLCYALIRALIAPVWDIGLQRFVPRSIHELSGLIYGTFGDEISVYLTIVIAAHAYAYFRQVQAEELERAQLQEALSASELQVVKSQLHPHFLFNTLQGISTLIETDPALAKKMLIRLSSLLRTALEYGSTDLISLDKELVFVAAYLELEAMRLGSRLQVRWDISPETRNFLVPQLILQPIVENALLYGVASRREGGWLEIASRRTDDLLELSVQNSVGGASRGGPGLGLKNTRARLRGLYSGDAAFSFDIDGRIAVTRLTFPLLGRELDDKAYPSIVSSEPGGKR